MLENTILLFYTSFLIIKCNWMENKADQSFPDCTASLNDCKNPQSTMKAVPFPAGFSIKVLLGSVGHGLTCPMPVIGSEPASPDLQYGMGRRVGDRIEQIFKI
jgi:hypothetical protein